MRNYFKKLYPNEEVIIPEESLVPLPKIKYDDDTKISDILTQAMDAELAAKNFYLELRYKIDDVEIKKLLFYLAKMEESHYHLLKSEFETEKTFEDHYDVYWDMMHVRP